MSPYGAGKPTKDAVDQTHDFYPIVEASALGMAVFSDQGECLYLNNAARYLLDVSGPALARGLPHLLLRRDHAYEVNTVAADGSVRVVELHNGTCRWEGEYARFVTLKDVTEYHEREVNARRMLADRDTFIAMLSHELRNPLSAVMAGVEVMRRLDTSRLAVDECGDVVVEQLEQIRQMLEDLLDVTRVSRGMFSVTRQAMDLVACVRAATRTKMPALESRKHSFESDLPTEPVLVFGDSARLRQGVVNLLDNAIKYTPEGGHIGLSLEVDAANSQVVVRVSDDGRGISAELLPRIFTRFSQGEQTTSRSEGGLGLGLALTKAIMDLHQGTIECERSEGGCGSVFTMRLPMLDEQETPFDARLDHDGLDWRGESLRVLLVEDLRGPRITTAKLLENVGCQVDAEETGVGAVHRLRSNSYDVALIDIGLPDISGLEVARLARSQVVEGLPMLIALTGYGQQSDRDESARAGFDVHMTKPFDLREFEIAVQERRIHQ